jgi:hypothetical protein
MIYTVYGTAPTGEPYAVDVQADYVALHLSGTLGLCRINPHITGDTPAELRHQVIMVLAPGRWSEVKMQEGADV